MASTSGTERERRRPAAGADRVEQVVPAVARSTDALDDLLDEIDEVLEEDAEEFVRGYVQKGGQ